MKLRKYIANMFEFVNESLIKNELNENFTNNIEFKTIGDYDDEIQDLNDKLNIINKYFPFKNVVGYYNTEEGLDLNFDNGIKIKGLFNEEPFLVDFIINSKNIYELNIHPFDSMGGFAKATFEQYIETIQTEENTISLVISHEGYALKSYSMTYKELDDYKIYTVLGTQIEGKVLGETIGGKRPYKEK